MTTDSSPPPPDRAAARIAEEAAAWFAQREAGFSGAQADAFAAWCAADARHAAALQHLDRTHARLTRLPESPLAARWLAELDELEARPRREPAAVIPWHGRGRGRLLIAVAAVAACFALVAWLLAPARALRGETYRTLANEQRTIDLPDGSKLSLSAQSEVHVELRAHERRLELGRGEAHFAVAKNPRRPFRVFAGPVVVQAVGTAFTVQRSTDAIEVAVTEGVVAVARQAAGADEFVLPAASSFTLVAGDRVVLGSDAPLPTAASPTTLADASSSTLTASAAAAWPAPRLVFRDTPLAEAVARFNRFSRVQMEIADDALAQRLIGGSFDADNAEAFVKLLADSGTLRAERLSATQLRLLPLP